MSKSARLSELTVDDFSTLVASPFRLILPDIPAIELTLRSATPIGSENTRTRRAFSLIFAGPKTPALPQKIYALENESLGTMEIFLVPIAETSDERQYEAIFT